MVHFSAGILRSNIHRVVNPPGGQRNSKRVSVVYFNRPEDHVILKVLDGSDMIDEQRMKHTEYDKQEKTTSREWVMRRSLGKRTYCFPSTCLRDTLTPFLLFSGVGGEFFGLYFLVR